MALQAVVAEHMPAGLRNEWDQDFTGAADWAGAQWLEELFYTAAAAVAVASLAAVVDAAFEQLLLLSPLLLLLLRFSCACWRTCFLRLLLQVSDRVLQAACCACMPTAAAAQHGQLG
jgi:hypothetical protein